MAQPALLFHYSTYRFHDRFALSVNLSARGITQFSLHLAMRRGAQMFAPADSLGPAFVLEFVPKICVRHIPIDLPLLQSLQVLQREKSGIRADSLRFPTTLPTGFTLPHVQRSAFLTVDLLNFPQVQTLHHAMHKKCQVIFAQHIPHVGWQLIGLI